MPVKKNPNLISSQVREKRRRLFWIRFNIILFFALVIIFTLAILSGHQKVSIQNFLIEGNGAVSTNQILNIAQTDISGRYLGLFARKNILLFPRLKIENDILNQIKTIKDVDVSWVDWQTVRIKVVERKPHSVWCGDDFQVKEQTCYFVDETGYVFSLAPAFSGTLFIKDYSYVEAENPIGFTILPQGIYLKIFSLIDILADYKISVSAWQVVEVAGGLDFTFILENGPKILFNDREGGFVASFQNLLTALDAGKIDLRNEENNIDYVDLRFESKVVVGKKNDKQQ